MNELALRDDDSGPATAETSALVLWAFEAHKAHQISQSLARTSFVPASLRGKPDDITAAILAGHELGLRPMATLRSMDVIQGTPALRAHAMRGLVQSRGHSVQLVESTETRCRMRGRRAGEDEWQTVTWTIERATKLGLTNKDQWRKQPQTMLVARATGEVCRLIASDVLHAMPYAAEELGDDTELTTVHAEVKPARRTARRAPLAAPVDTRMNTQDDARAAGAGEPRGAQPPEPPAEPDLDEPEPAEPAGRVYGADPEPDVEPEPTPGPEPMSGAQNRMMHALFRGQGIADRDERLAYVGGVIGRDVESSKDLTKDEAARVIDQLTAEPAREPTLPVDEGQAP